MKAKITALRRDLPSDPWDGAPKEHMGHDTHYVLATNRDKMRTLGTSASEVPNGDNTGTKGTSSKPDTKPTKPTRRTQQ
jgi:hypothetical protein